MIDIPVHNATGQQVGSLQIDEQLLGGEIRPALLKQAFVRVHANKRLGTVKTKKRSEVEGSTKKLYKQKGTGNARRGDRKSNILRGGGHGHSKKPHSWRLDMPRKMRRLANRNALLAKAVDGEIKVLDSLKFDKPSTKQFTSLLSALKINRTCLLALADTRGTEARSAQNIDDISVTQVDRLNVYDLLNHRFLLVDKSTLEGYIARIKTQLADDAELPVAEEVAA
jgi:large subunit ribosomal protein L4